MLGVLSVLSVLVVLRMLGEMLLMSMGVLSYWLRGHRLRRHGMGRHGLMLGWRLMRPGGMVHEVRILRWSLMRLAHVRSIRIVNRRIGHVCKGVWRWWRGRGRSMVGWSPKVGANTT
jgi:hypothetical protein